MSENKSVQQWSSEETSVLLAIWSSSEIQEKLERSKMKKRVYDEMSQEMLNGGFSRSTDQIINKLKKLRKEYRDQKRKPSKRGSVHINTNFDHDFLESVLGQRPASQPTGALNSATVTLETSDDSPVFSVADLGSRIAEYKTKQQWTSEETSALLAIWSSTEIQERLENSKRKKRVYDDICQEMVNVGFTRTTDQIINKLKKLKKEFRDQKKEPSKSSSQLSNKSTSHVVMDAVLEQLPVSQFTEALNSATAMLESNTESLSSAADLECSVNKVLDQAESSFNSSQTQPRKSLETTRIKRKDSNQELLEYLQTADERFMAHAKELNTAILNKMDEATNSILGLLGRMVTLMERQQGNKP
ncbi:zinc finger and SCAN domain-containing protein 20 [Pseudorasbora parva]|uniref:zinc finger and SCAN domain-containing protein 20 n=1 Tax=Pseudorasbora parva TaxID=51549 RepID=UPI00351F0DCD